MSSRTRRGPRRIYGTELHDQLTKSGVFDKVVYEGSNGGCPGVFFHIERDEYRAFVRWHSEPRRYGYGRERGIPSRISLLSVSEGDEHLMWWEEDPTLPQVKELDEEHSRDPELKAFLDDIVAHMR